MIYEVVERINMLLDKSFYMQESWHQFVFSLKNEGSLMKNLEVTIYQNWTYLNKTLLQNMKKQVIKKS